MVFAPNRRSMSNAKMVRNMPHPGDWNPNRITPFRFARQTLRFFKQMFCFAQSNDESSIELVAS